MRFRRTLTLLLLILLVPTTHADNLKSVSGPEAAAANVERTRAELKTRAQSGDVEAQYQLGSLLASAGEDKLALKWLTTAAEAKHYQAATALGKMYASGLGAPLDPNQAAEWFQKASKIAEAEGTEEEDC